ncbi:MAG: O-methyltransferase [Bacteroidetes bacterium]|jgi:caffeoyl-CoA O-methyltransferase|nr:O-methyltransferase [Bacteroidota bacterium]MDA1018662.1 O-methyltransferase [Bacteroidota bacterium]|tara:strand:+ start:9100 stop:9759 length:660 start_codon:yes stop_codon:yes gene_type:complete
MLKEKMNDFINKEILDYVESFSQKEPSLLKELNRETNLKVLNPRMLSGAYQGRILSMISKLIKPKNVLEIGTYTGYSAICISEGLDLNGVIHTIDKNEELFNIQRKYFDKTNNGKVFLQYTGNAIDIIPTINVKFDLVFIDADKENYLNYLRLVIDKLNTNGIIITDNVLWSGKILKKPNEEDIATKILIEFNDFINNHVKLETIILPIRDGISISRKN